MGEAMTVNKNIRLLSVFVILLQLMILQSVLVLPPASAAKIGYAYNKRGQLIRVDYGSSKVICYAYDAAGNRISTGCGTAVIDTEPNSINIPWTLTESNSFIRTTGMGDLTLNDLTPGTYTLTWGYVNNGWTKPSPEFSTQTLTSGGTVTYTGTYVPTGNPQIQITPASLNFRYVHPGAYKDLTLQVKNVGTGTLTGTVHFSPPFSIVSGGSYSLGANQSQQVVVRYTAPLQEESQTGSLHFTGGGELTIQVKGTNQNATLPWLMLLFGY
jgi:YD repeat-containing protein